MHTINTYNIWPTPPILTPITVEVAVLDLALCGAVLALVCVSLGKLVYNAIRRRGKSGRMALLSLPCLMAGTFAMYTVWWQYEYSCKPSAYIRPEYTTTTVRTPWLCLALVVVMVCLAGQWRGAFSASFDATPR